MTGAEELRLDIGWGTLSALAWRRPGRPRALCLHGWMDNATSFAPLAPLLPELDLVALDFAGHGHSDHRPEGTQYYFTDYLFDVDAALDALGWDRCGVIGHSLGAGIGATFACAAPERLHWLVMVDGLGTLSEPPAAVRERVGRSLASVRQRKSHRRTYATIEAAAATRQANNPMHADSARLLAERALVREEQAYRWRTDGRLLWTSPIFTTEEQALSLLQGVHCPALAITTEALHQFHGDQLEPRLAAVEGLVHAAVSGGHHLHMDDPGLVAECILPFLARHGAQ